MPTIDVVARTSVDQVFFQLVTDNFVFSRDCADSENVTAGHAHVYVDSVRISSMYGSASVIKIPQPGLHKISVSLNVLPDHKFVSHKGVPVRETVVVDIAG